MTEGFWELFDTNFTEHLGSEYSGLEVHTVR